jgi:DNA-binding transcriptional ArsR family regulator
MRVAYPLCRMSISVYVLAMARAATTTDVFNAVAEPRRREILDRLGADELAVGELVAGMALAQPLVSKHLRVLREVGLVDVRSDGRQRLYRVNGPALKPLHDWVAGFRAMWDERFDAVDDVLADLVGREEHRDDARDR